QFALGLYNGNISIRSAAGEEQVRIERGTSPIWTLAWSPAEGLEANVLAVADWSQKLSFFQSTGRQIGKDRPLTYDPCGMAYFGNGEYILLGGSNREVSLWTADGLQMGKVCSKDGWVWACRAKPKEPYVAVASADGTVAVYQIQFQTVHAIYNDRYAFRQNMTEVVVQFFTANQKTKIKCKDCIQKVAIYKDTLAVQIPGKVYIYEVSYDENGELHYRMKEKILRTVDCATMVVTAAHVLFCSDKKIEMLSFAGETIHEWTFESLIRYVKVIGGPRGQEGLLVGLKDGHVLKVFIDNPFPISLIRHNFPIKCVDINLSRKRIAVVDDENTGSVYDIQSKELLYQEPETTSVAWNTELENAICFSGLNGIVVKRDSFVCYQQRLSGFAVGFKGTKVFSLNNYSMTTTDIPQAVPLEGYLESGDFASAYQVACSGIPEADWRRLAITSMEQLSLDVAKKAFGRIRDFKYLEAIRAIEKMKQEGRRETDLFQAEVLAYCENYQEVQARVLVLGGPTV
ncbi:hypothetical protein HDU91_006582, partial [Kappamyces sp. JEL0680]